MIQLQHLDMEVRVFSGEFSNQGFYFLTMAAPITIEKKSIDGRV
jgi:hypothetical protein